MRYRVTIYRSHEGDGTDTEIGTAEGEARDAAEAIDKASSLPQYIDRGHGYEAEPILWCPGCDNEIDVLHYSYDARLEVSVAVDLQEGKEGPEIRFGGHEDESESWNHPANVRVWCAACQTEFPELAHLVHVQGDWEPVTAPVEEAVREDHPLRAAYEAVLQNLAGIAIDARRNERHGDESDANAAYHHLRNMIRHHLPESWYAIDPLGE